MWHDFCCFLSGGGNKMKKTLFFIVIVAFFVSSGFSNGQEDYSDYAFAWLSYVKGDVYIQRVGDLGYEEGVVNLLIVEGDKLGTREGRAEVHFGKRNYLRIDSDTQLDFVKLPQNGEGEAKLHLLSGKIYLRINFLDGERNFEVHSPDASFYIIEEGLYRLEVKEGETELFVFEGKVEAAGEESSFEVEGGEKLVSSNGHFLSEPGLFYESQDDSFAQWNGSRDSLHQRAVSRRYLASELEDYEAELAESGRWVYEQPYGYVWTPYVSYHDWRPYYYGRWVWYPISGWTWVSYEPWGWCVYHYGRWHWRLGLGWYWIPQRVWSPAWVHWYWGYDYVGWCPLSCYGYPVVIINNNFYGHGYGRYYPSHSRALTVVRKDQLRSRTISRAALSQDKILSLGKISLSSKQPGYQPTLKQLSAEDIKAARVFSRSSLRPVSKSYGLGKNISHNQLKSLPSRRSSSGISRSISESGVAGASDKIARVANSRMSPRIFESRLSSSSPRKSEAVRSGQASLDRSGSTVSAPRSYPSRMSRPSTRSISAPSSSSGERSPFSFGIERKRSNSSSSRTFSSRLDTRPHSEKIRSSPSFRSGPSSPSSSKRSSFLSSIPSHSKRNFSSRASSALGSRISTSGSRSSSSGSAASHSSTRRSSSNSRSGKSVKKN
jgi:hypothetical protein